MADGSGAASAAGGDGGASADTGGAANAGQAGGAGAGTEAVTGQTVTAPAWHGDLNAEEIGWMQNKQWFGKDVGKADIAKSFPNMVRSYRGMEKLVGDPAKRINLPTGDNDAEGWKDIYSKLGRPADAKGYDYKVPDGGDQEFGDAYSEMAWKHGLSTKQMQGLAEDWNKFGMERVQARQASENEQFSHDSNNDLNGLRREWGRDFDMKMGAAQRAGLAFGIDKPTMHKIERAIGTKAFLNMMSSVGSSVSEDTGAGQGGNAGGDGMTPEMANARLAELKNDREWLKKYDAGDKEAVALFRKLTTAKANGMAG